jgi:hypothetical protein
MTKNPHEGRDRAEDLRVQGARCRRPAKATTDREIARKLLELAREFEQRIAADKVASSRSHVGGG